MKIDLHIHTRTCSDGALPLEEVFKEADLRRIELISMTDHDSVECQKRALALAERYGMSYLSGVELNVTFEYPMGDGTVKSVSLDFLGYQYDVDNRELKSKLRIIKEHREARARQILDRINAEFAREGITELAEQDLKNIEQQVDGAFGRPHIADYLVEKGVVKNRQEAFDRYLVKCDVPKYPLSLAEASALIRNAGGVLVLAHPNDPNGTSLVAITRDLREQANVIEGHMMGRIDGIECWHVRHDAETAEHYVKFARGHGLLMTGGSDCHQKPIVMGTVDVPDWVADQFGPAGGGRTRTFKGAMA